MSEFAIDPARDAPAVGGLEQAPVFPALDTLRLLGALGVLLTHTAFWAGAYTQINVIGPLLARLDVGVAIFFVLSGFLLSRPWFARARAGIAEPAVGRYFFKRLLRIYPVYLVTAVIALSLLHDNRGRGVLDWLVTLTLTDIYVHPSLPAGLTQMWSLATEVAFYIVLPVLMWLLIGRRRSLHPARAWIGLALMAIASPLWLGVIGPRVPGTADLPVYEWLPAFLLWFAAGMTLALLHVLFQAGDLSDRVRRTLTGIGSLPGVVWLVCLGVMLVASTPLAGPTLLLAPTPAEAVTKNLLYTVIGCLTVLLGVFGRPGSRYLAVMSRPRLRHLGHISYSIFCIHLPILHFVMWVTGYQVFDGHLLQITLLTAVLSWIAAELLYRYVEVPALRLRNLGRPASAATQKATESTSTTR